MTVQDMTKYKGWFDVCENDVYVVTVCTVEFAVSAAVDLLSRYSERSDMRNARQVHISDS